MAWFEDLATDGQLTALVNTAAITSTANGSSVTVGTNLGPRMATAIQWVGAVSGTSPTLDSVIQESSDGSTWTDCLQGNGVTTAAFTQQTAANSIEAVSFVVQKPYIRIRRVLTGTSPSFTAGAAILYLKQTAGSNSGGWVNDTAATVV